MKYIILDLRVISDELILAGKLQLKKLASFSAISLIAVYNSTKAKLSSSYDYLIKMLKKRSIADNQKQLFIFHSDHNFKPLLIFKCKNHKIQF